ncbi:MAG: S46 family peptidase [Alcanivoracaceae bacterium]|nr:S46 family peptidase [Alcanivoracaceae bacterium]
MYKIIKYLLIFIIPIQAIAVEGMWQPRQLLDLAEDVKSKGLDIPVENISDLDKHPMTAMVSLGFCSASFVSDTGLIITNHHCAYGAIQYNSTSENNLIDKGFYASHLKDELTGGPGLYIYVTEDITDVSKQMVKELDGLHGRDRYDKMDFLEKNLIDNCESKDVYRCSVRVFHGGLKFYLIKQLQIKDVRLVYAPSDSIGKYGGDVDNWMWPRHTGDFSFLRAYVAKNGDSVEFSKDNVPYHSKSYLTVNQNGLQENDFAMVLGYPGRTSRHKLAEEIDSSVLWRYPMIIKSFTKYIELVEKESKIRPEVTVKYASRMAGINNYMKNSEGMLDGFKNPQALNNKKQAEKEFKQWLFKTDNKTATAALDQLEKLLTEKKQYRDRNFYIGQVKRSQLLSAANRLYRLSKEKTKADVERNSRYQKRNWGRIKNSIERINKSFDNKMDRILMEDQLNEYAQLSMTERSAEFDKLFNIKGDDKDGTRISVELDKLYKNSELANKEIRMAWLDKTPEQFESSIDSFIQLAVSMYTMNMEKEQKDEVMTANLQEAQMNYMQAYLSYAKDQGLPVYADANSTLRVTYGNVMGYSAQDAIKYSPFTSLEGILQKDTGQEPFDAPDKLLKAIKSKDYSRYKLASINSVPVNFLTDLDITGGNSGSPTLDSQARLVGLAFDGNYESINADWIFNKKLTKTIHVDIRYILWIMDKIDNADRLLNEMGVEK